MFQLIDLILISVAGLMFAALRDTVYAAMILADCDDCGFSDLGTLLFGGIILAVLVGIAGSLVWRRAKHRSGVIASQSEKIHRLEPKQNGLA
jgi:hypothetical protein